MNKQVIKDALILTVITLCAGLFLGYIFQITKSPIAKQKAKAKQEAYQKVFTDADSFDKENLKAKQEDSGNVTEALLAKDSSGKKVGYVMSVTNSEGYGGDITISMGIKEDGTITGIEFLSISETAGLGMKAKEPAFKDQFKNKNVKEFKVTKTGVKGDEEIDALSGATITSNAVTRAVNAGIAYYNEVKEGGANE